MRLIVSDSSCLIDLRKASLLEAFLDLPYEVLIPDALFEEELVRFTPAQKDLLLQGGLKVVEVPAESVLRARAIVGDYPQLSIHDAFAFALADSCEDRMLLTGDSGLRALAESYRLEVHGTLWVIDQIHNAGLAPTKVLLAVLRDFTDDPNVRLPRRELAARIRRYKKAE
ncbi:MAG: hypothetical protein F4X12_00335 [Acidobacteriia bacterium]|nr:hypothetical protein [Terriglobia bacterium]